MMISVKTQPVRWTGVLSDAVQSGKFSLHHKTQSGNWACCAVAELRKYVWAKLPRLPSRSTQWRDIFDLGNEFHTAIMRDDVSKAIRIYGKLHTFRHNPTLEDWP